MSYSSTPSYRIDILDQVGRAYQLVRGQARLVLEMALLPFAVVLAAQLIGQLLPLGIFGAVLAAMANIVAFLMFGTVFVVRWHRYVLLGEGVGNDLIPAGWDAFVIAGLKIGGLFLAGWVVLAVFAIAPFTFPLALFGSVALGLAVLRLSLVFPAAAVERPVSLRTAWYWIEGNFWRFFACAICCYLPFVIVELVIGWFALGLPSFAHIVAEALRLAVSFAGAAVVAALLSNLYLAIVGGPR